MKKRRLVTRGELAVELGVSYVRACQLVSCGRIKVFEKGSKLIDLEVARKAFAEGGRRKKNPEGRKRGRKPASEKKQLGDLWEVQKKEAEKKEDQPKVVKEIAYSELPSYADSTKRKEYFLALKVEADYLKQIGSLIDKQAANRYLATLAREARDSLTSIADRLAPILAGVEDPHKVRTLITKEVESALRSFCSSKIEEEGQE